MRKLSLALFVLVLTSSVAFAFNAELHTPSKLPETIVFHGVEFHKAFEDVKDDAFIIEYLPKDQTLEQWTELFAIRKEASPLSPLDRVKGIAAYLKKVNPNFKSQILKNKKADDAGIDFLVWPDDESMGEFNSWKYIQGETGTLYSYQYGRRGYTGTPSNEEFFAFMKNKQKAVIEMMDFKLSAN